MKLISLLAAGALTFSPLAALAGSDAGEAMPAAGGATKEKTKSEWDCPRRKGAGPMAQEPGAMMGRGQGPGPMYGQGPGPRYGQGPGPMMGQGRGPMMYGPQGGMGDMAPPQYDAPMMGRGMGMGRQMGPGEAMGRPPSMQDRMDAMEGHLSNIETLLQEMVELQKKQ